MKIVIKSNTQQVELPGKVLVCGPSNAAVDEIIRKLLNEKLFDKEGKRYVPKFVRIGDNYDSSLAEHSLEELAIKECNKKTQSDMAFEKMKILKDYKLVFGTLSSVGHQIVANADICFDTVIIDEAGQSIEI
jgi:superfamily I DNA and/or RNA helicase